MKKQTKADLAALLFMGLCLIPGLGMFLLPREQAAANQVLAPAPSIWREEGGLNPQLLQEVSDYVRDHFALRQRMITANAALEAGLFHTSAQESVLLGREGWLFYRETLEDYLHTEPMSRRQLFSAARSLGLLSEYVREQGAQFFFTVAPNKVSLYPQYLPAVGSPLEGEDTIDRLRPLLEQEGVAYIDLFVPFRDTPEPLYHARDSHWTVRGAALARDTLLSALGQETEALFSQSYQVRSDHRGDLYEMLYPTGERLEEEAEYERTVSFEYVRPIRSMEDQRIETENPQGSGSLLLFRDSFGNTLCPLLAQDFQSCLFSRSMPCQMELLGQSGAELVVLELVERNLDYLITRPPIFPAPRREMAQPEQTGRVQLSLRPMSRQSLTGYVGLEGILTGEPDFDSPLYLWLDGVGYEATPAGEGWEEGTPFSLYVPEGLSLEGGRLCCYENGTLCSVPVSMKEI